MLHYQKLSVKQFFRGTKPCIANLILKLDKSRFEKRKFYDRKFAMTLKINVEGERYKARISFKPDFDINAASEHEIQYLMKMLARLLEVLDKTDESAATVNVGNFNIGKMKEDG